MTENEDFKKKYELGKKIERWRSEGEGVFEVIGKKSGEKRAVKIIDKKDIIENFIKYNCYKEPTEEEKKSLFNEIYNEVEIMKEVEGKNKDNKNTVKYYESFETENEFAIIMELCDTDLLRYFQRRKEAFNVDEIHELLTQLNNTFKIMHELKMSHRDLSLNNILIKYENDKIIYKLSDYGVSKKLDIRGFFETICGKQDFMAPEVKTGKYDRKCDLWSLGIIIYILLRRRYPPIEIISRIELTDNPDLNNLIRRLLVEDPDKRLSWDEYFFHPFVYKKNQIIIKLKVSDNDKIKNEFKDIYLKTYCLAPLSSPYPPLL